MNVQKDTHSTMSEGNRRGGDLEKEKKVSLLVISYSSIALRGLSITSGSTLVGEESRVDRGDDTSRGDGDVAEELVDLLVVADSELDVTGDDTLTVVLTGGVTGELDDLSSEVLEDGTEEDGCTSTDTLGVVAVAEETVDTTDGEVETSTHAAALGLGLASLCGGDLLDGSLFFGGGHGCLLFSK